MELKDYINKVEEAKKKELPAWARVYQNIDFFTIPDDKLKLIKSFNTYITTYNFNNYAAKFNDSKSQGYIMQQVKTQKNSTTGILIETKICSRRSNGYDDYWVYESLNEQEYKARTSKYRLEGSQEFYKLYMYPNAGEFTSIYEGNFLNFTGNVIDHHIFFSKDGNVFLRPFLVDAINRYSIDQLGMFLAQEAIKTKQKKYPN